MSAELRFIATCLIMSLGLAVLELFAYVGITNVIAIPFTLFHHFGNTYFVTMAWIMGGVIGLYGVYCLVTKRYGTGINLLLSIAWALAMSWVLVQSAAFNTVPTF